MRVKSIAALLFVLIGVVILVSLGTWQMMRLSWKEGIITTLSQGYDTMAQGNLTPLSSVDLEKLSQQNDPLLVGAVHGRFLIDKAILLGPRTHDGRAGFHLILPLSLADGRGMLLVNAGWVSDLWHDTLLERLRTLPEGGVTVQGILRKPDWSRFTSANSPENNLWFRPDIGEIAKEKGLTSPAPFPILLYAATMTPPPPQDLVMNDKEWYPRNKHGQYALFWYAMALTLICVYAAVRFLKNRATN